jgi:hypothetical protein
METKMREFMGRDTMNVEHDFMLIGHTSSNWSHWNINRNFNEKFRSHTMKTSVRFTTKDSYTWNISDNMETRRSAIVKRPVTRDNNNNSSSNASGG